MLKKSLQKKVEVMTDENTFGISGLIKLEYYLLEGEAEEYKEISGEKAYGIEIVKSVEGRGQELETVRNFSFCKDTTLEILGKLARNQVTPIELPYIIDDMLGIA